MKVTNIQNIRLNGKKVTIFNVWRLDGKTWIFDYKASIKGWYKRAKIVEYKHAIDIELFSIE